MDYCARADGMGIHHTEARAFDSIPSGDVVLAVPPPYLSRPWLGAGLPLLAGLLANDGIRARIPRFLDDPYAVPEALVAAAHELQWGYLPLDERTARMRELAAREEAFFERLLDRLTAGGERVFGLSVWRTNVDVVLELARRLRDRDPDCTIVLGGPEASESTEDVKQDCVDVVVTGAAEGVIAPVMRALLEGEPLRAGEWDNVWVHPRHGQTRSLLRKSAAMPPLPKIDYAGIVPMLADDLDPRVPVLLNIGCPFRCTFCVNTNLYPELAFGEVDRLVAEMVEIMSVWKACFPDGRARPVKLLLCDAAANAFPAQFDELCRKIIEADFPLRPHKINALVLIDGRLTAERAQLMVQAGFDVFFGLESAAPRIRRVMKKPGAIEKIAHALEAAARATEGRFRVTPGVIVGWPDETEEELHETIAFLDWMIALGITDVVNVTPMRRSQAMMDPTLLAGVEGPPVGLTWRGRGPAGDPRVRARRYLNVFEHFGGVVTVASAAPPSVVIRLMLGTEARAFWERWMRLRPDDGDTDLELGALRDRAQRELRPPSPEPGARPNAALAGGFARGIEPLLRDALSGLRASGWALSAVRDMPGHARAALVELSHESGKKMGVLLAPRSERGEAYRRTARFDVSYLQRLEGTTYDFDAALVERLVERLARTEHALEPAAE
ncbi:MAG: B12-binding domain-containing radical SAM protein [Sandaracinaceae bacterium]|nr:B12-binding domain-containing radical SAM protein [Sandaracinaceae bacterium]